MLKTLPLAYAWTRVLFDKPQAGVSSSFLILQPLKDWGGLGG